MSKPYKNWIQFVLGLSKNTLKKQAPVQEPTHVHYHVHVHMESPKLYQRVLEQVSGGLPLAVAPVPVKAPVSLEVPYQTLSSRF